MPAKLPKPSYQVMAEVFGYPIDNFTPIAEITRSNQLCPFHNRIPNCTKDKAKNPLGVCSIHETKGDITITCPVRFSEDWIITADAAEFFFPPNTKWTTLVEVPLNDKESKSAGNIDYVLVAYNEQGEITDFGTIEVQAVYISGNIRNIFENYMQNRSNYKANSWSGQNPKPDYLSSSRKRLAPQLLFKGGIIHSWNKKMAVVLNTKFFNTLPLLEEVPPVEADIVWLIYDLMPEPATNRYKLVKTRAVYTKFNEALTRITNPNIGEVNIFLNTLQKRLDKNPDFLMSNHKINNPATLNYNEDESEEGLV